MTESYATAAEDARPGVELAARASGGSDTGWPELHLTERCDGENPMTGTACINGRHTGYHRDAGGAEWLDD